jgi:hypothetical protein
MLISTVRRRLIPAVTSLVDRVTTVLFSCFVDNYCLSCTVSTLLAIFLLPKMAERRISAARGCVTLEVKSLSNSLTLIWHRSALEFLVIFYLSKVI